MYLFLHHFRSGIVLCDLKYLICFYIILGVEAVYVILCTYFYIILGVEPVYVILYICFYIILGVEPFSYYILNGLLNFNAVFVWALFSLPFVVCKVLLEFHIDDKLLFIFLVYASETFISVLYKDHSKLGPP